MSFQKIFYLDSINVWKNLMTTSWLDNNKWHGKVFSIIPKVTGLVMILGADLITGKTVSAKEIQIAPIPSIQRQDKVVQDILAREITLIL
jgi:hypothetical protein